MLTHGVTTRARTLLRVLQGILIHIVGFLTQDHTILHKHLVYATTTTVAPTVNSDPFATVDSGCIGLHYVGFQTISISTCTTGFICARRRLIAAPLCFLPKGYCSKQKIDRIS